MIKIFTFKFIIYILLFFFISAKIYISKTNILNKYILWLIEASMSSVGSFSTEDGSDAMSATCSKSSLGIFNISATSNCFSSKACLIISSLRLRHSEKFQLFAFKNIEYCIQKYWKRLITLYTVIKKAAITQSRRYISTSETLAQKNIYVMLMLLWLTTQLLY